MEEACGRSKMSVSHLLTLKDAVAAAKVKVKQQGRSSVSRCSVCGDRGVGVKFGVSACYSCKTFFQRNSDRFEKLKCLKRNECPVDISTRKCCPKCRLRKMIQLGMMRPSTGSQLLRTVDATLQMTSSENQSVTEGKTTSRSFIDSQVDRLVAKEGLISSATNSSPSSSTPSSASFFTPHRYRYHFGTALNLEERKQLSELSAAMNSVFIDERLLPRHSLLYNLADAFNWPANYATKVVAFCRALPAYACLPPEDQLAVLKQFYMELLTLRTSFHYDPVANGFPVLANDRGTESIFCSFDHLIPVDFKMKNPEVIDLNRNYTREWHQLLEGDEQLFCLMTGFFLFHDKAGLQRQEFARHEHAKACRLLLKYLEQKYRNVEVAGKAYNRLFGAVQRLERLKTANMAFLEIIPKVGDGYQYPGVLAELFNVQL